MSSISVQDLSKKQRSLVAHELGISSKQLHIKRDYPEGSTKSERFQLRKLAERLDGSKTRR
jgi:hypothetical protein